MMRRAFEEAARCVPSPERWAVGAVFVAIDGRTTTGFTGEDLPHRHAEEVALDKAMNGGIPTDGGTLYTTLEPCSVRLSGRTPCTTHILAAGIRRVVFAAFEPPHYVQCRGKEILEAAGLEVIAATAQDGKRARDT